MQVGDKVWIFDSNRRQYNDDKGNKLDRCWYRGHFVEKYIVGETKQSWVIGYKGDTLDSRSNIKVNKKTLTYNGSYGQNGKVYISEEQVDQTCWINDNQYEISKMVGQCKDYHKLKEIEAILNRE